MPKKIKLTSAQEREREMQEQYKVLNTGDLDLIGRCCDLDVIEENLGIEFLERLLADRVYPKRTPAERNVERDYIIPGRTESPACSYNTLRSWIREFCGKNDLELDQDFYRKNKKQLLGMYFGMLRTYRITEDNIVGKFT